MDLSPEDAIKEYVKNKKNREFVFQKVVYHSFTECCHEFGVTPSAVDQYRKEKKLMRRRGLIAYLKHVDNTFCFANVIYKDFATCCKTYGVNSNLVRAYERRSQADPHTALIHYLIHAKYDQPNLEAIPVNILDSICYKDTTYPNVVVCCEALRIDLEAVYESIDERGLKLNDAIQFLDENNIRIKRNPDKDLNQGIYYQNVFYMSLKRCCEQLGIAEGTVRNRMWDKKCSVEEALDHYNKTLSCPSKRFSDGTSKTIQLYDSSGKLKTYQRTKNAVYDLTYHIVFKTIARKKIISAEIAETLRQKMQNLIGEQEGEILRFEYRQDYVHIHAALRPDCLLTKLIIILKVNTTCCLKEIYQDFLDANCPEGSFWERGYFISSGDEMSEKTIEHYLSYKSKK